MHLETTIGLASQYINDRNINRTLATLIEWNEVDDECLTPEYKFMDNFHKSRRVIECMIKNKDKTGDLTYRKSVSPTCMGPLSYPRGPGVYKCRKTKRKDSEL